MKNLEKSVPEMFRKPSERIQNQLGKRAVVTPPATPNTKVTATKRRE
jgi:hypothetical protein